VGGNLQRPPAARAGASAAAAAVFALVVLACFAALLITQRVKHTPTVVQHVLGTRWMAFDVHGHEVQEISFRIKQADRVTVTIEDSGGRTVATVIDHQLVPRYLQCLIYWNGVLGSGVPAPAGTYTPRFHLLGQGRSILSPRSFVVRPHGPVVHPYTVYNTGCRATTAKPL
jgi:hypothetical protein